MNRQLPKTLTEQESKALLAAAEKARDRCAISLMQDMGLRATECATVRITGIDWNNQIIRFRGKGGKGYI